MDEIYKMTSAERIQMLEKELAMQLSQVAESKELVIQEDVLQRELESCLRRVYTPENRPLLLLQYYTERITQLALNKYLQMLRWKRFCWYSKIMRQLFPLYKARQYLSISNVLSVAVDKVPEVGQENENVHISDISPDIQGSASPRPMDTSIPGPARTEAAFVLPQHMTEREELKPQLRLLLSHFNIPYDMEELRNAAKETGLFPLVYQKFQNIFPKQQRMQRSPDYDVGKAKVERLGLAGPRMTLKKRASWVSFIKIKPKCDPWQKKPLTKLKEWRIDVIMQLQAKFLKNENMEKDDLSMEQNENNPAQISLSQRAGEPVKWKEDAGCFLLPLSWPSEVDDNQVGKFSFYTKETILKEKNSDLRTQGSTRRSSRMINGAERLLSAPTPKVPDTFILPSVRSQSARRTPEAFVSVQPEKVGLQGMMLNAFLLRKPAVADAVESLMSADEIGEAERDVIVEYCQKFNHCRSHYALQGQIMAYGNSLRALRKDFPTIRDTFFMGGATTRKKGLRDSKEGLKAEPRYSEVEESEERQEKEGQGLQNLERNRVGGEENRLLSRPSFQNWTDMHLTPNFTSCKLVSELPGLQKMIDSPQSPQDPTQVSQALLLRREVMFLQFDASVRHLIRRTLLTAGNAAAYQPVTDGLDHGLPPLRSSLVKIIFAAQLRLPPPLDPQSPRAFVLFPWRAFLQDGGPFPVMSSSPATLEYNTQITFRKEHLEACLLSLGCDVTARERSNFESCSMCSEHVLEHARRKLCQEEQVAELSHNMTMEITALRACLVDLEEGNLNLEKQIRKEVQEEYEDLVKTLFTACLRMKKLNENQLNLIQKVYELISKVRTEWTENVKDLKKIWGSARPDEGTKESVAKEEQLWDLEQNSSLTALVSQVQSLGRFRPAEQGDKVNPSLPAHDKCPVTVQMQFEIDEALVNKCGLVIECGGFGEGNQGSNPGPDTSSYVTLDKLISLSIQWE
ncbi:hypothetical protein HJG60_010503 [Phyllostomus discolor]|uniref:DUF4549 domain-containing protein n=1 Tax=Phyllostomus discolor TaxID=89673 RepID=A0A834AHG5_9CHIR|nr:hypothetical protein HJG60_010503 [Phyllostomus discolor]